MRCRAGVCKPVLELKPCRPGQGLVIERSLTRPGLWPRCCAIWHAKTASCAGGQTYGRVRAMLYETASRSRPRTVDPRSRSRVLTKYRSGRRVMVMTAERGRARYALPALPQHQAGQAHATKLETCSPT